MKVNVRDCRARWERACLLHNEGDLLKATIGRDLYAATDPEAAWVVLTSPAPEGLGLHPNTASSVRSMGEALVALPDESVWRAAGWGGIRALLRLSAAKRKKAIRDILKQAKGTELGATAVRVIVSHHGGKAATTRRQPAASDQPVTSTPIASTNGTTPAPVTPAPTREQPKDDRLDLVLADLRKLVSQPLLKDLVLGLLSPEVRALVGSKKQATRKAS